MGSQVNVEGNEAKTKKDDSGACAIHSLDQPNGDPIDISPAKPSAFLPANLRNPVLHQQQLRHSKLYLSQATLKGFSAEFDCDASAGVTPTGATAVSTTSCSVLMGCAHHARGRLATMPQASGIWRHGIGSLRWLWSFAFGYSSCALGPVSCRQMISSFTLVVSCTGLLLPSYASNML